MFIVDYSTDYNNRDIITKTFNEASSIIHFIAESSESSNFKLERISKYERGRLHPYEVSLKNGRISIEEGALEAN